jgi:hypothetical protein
MPLEWSVVEPSAKLAFGIWMGQPELIWAKKAFDVPVAAGLVEETDPFSRHIAFFRVLVLDGIYRDFCDAAWDETSWIYYAEWCEPDEIVDRFVIGQMFAWMPDWDADEEVEFSVALDRLVEAEREIVVEALGKGFGGTQAYTLRCGGAGKIRMTRKRGSMKWTALNQITPGTSGDRQVRRGLGQSQGASVSALLVAMIEENPAGTGKGTGVLQTADR